MKKNNIDLLVVNDNGNSEQALRVNGKLILQPNVYAVPIEKPTLRDVPAETLIPFLEEEIYVSITSISIDFNGDYLIGKKAINSKYSKTNMNVEIEKKYTSDLPIINTIGNLGVAAVKEYYEKNKEIPASLDVSVDMFTALPINQWTPETAKAFADRFQKTHNVIVHINDVSVNINMKFDLVKVAPEGTPALFYLVYGDDRKHRPSKDPMFEYYRETYKKEVTGEELSTKRISHIDIGDGTTDFAITVGYNFNNDVVVGENYGAGHAIEDALKLFKKENTLLAKTTRQKFSEFLKDESHQYHELATKLLRTSLTVQARFILDSYKQVVADTGNEIDIITVYGGGSILMRDVLEPALKKFADSIGKEIIWVPEQYASLMNVEGLQILAENLRDKLKAVSK